MSVSEPGPTSSNVVLAVDSGCGNHTAHGVGVVNKILAEGLTRPKIELFGKVPNFGPAQQSDCQDAPTLPLHGPRTPTLTGPSDLSNRDLLFTCCQICPRSIPQTAVSLPGVFDQLHTAEEPVAGIDRPVATRFTLGQRIPRGAITHRRHFRAQLGAHPQHTVDGRRNDDIGYWQSSGSVPLTLAMANVTSCSPGVPGFSTTCRLTFIVGSSTRLLFGANGTRWVAFSIRTRVT